MLFTNPYNIITKHAAEFLNITEEELLESPIPYYQYSQDKPRYYRKRDLDLFIEKNVLRNKKKRNIKVLC